MNSRHARLLFICLAVLCGLIVAYGIFFRVYHLSFPNKQVFDEVYFPVFARDYIDGISFYDVHPPLGKFVIAVGMFFWGDNTVGWRIMPAIFGVGIIALMAQLWWTMFKDKVGALLIAAFVAMDGMFIIYSRTGLMDGVLFFFTFVTFLASTKLEGKYRMFWFATLFGLTCAIKWPSVALIVPALIFAHRQRKTSELLLWLVWSAIVYFGILIIGQQLIHSPDPIGDAWAWNSAALHYHETLTATHPWSSPWWSWPLLMKPVLFTYDALANGKYQVTTTLGNPVLWWTSTVSMVMSSLYVVYRQIKFRERVIDHPLTPFIVGFFAFWLPWAGIGRVIFLYHYFPAYGFALLVLTYWISSLWKKAPQAVLAAVVVFFAVSVFFLPFSIGYWSLTKAQVDARTWIGSWL
jgi:dolichyl-phosphate-mannose-protein mannosyltransferase